MSATDWAITNEGDPISHRAFQNALVSPQLPRPVGDDWCRYVWDDGGAAYGRNLFLYDRGGGGGGIGVYDDVSVRAALCIASRAAINSHSVGIGVRMTTLPGLGATNHPGLLSTDGYHLVVVPVTSTQFDLNVNRVITGSSTTLWSTSRVTTVGVYRWFHLRLDIMTQPNHDVRLQVFENDLTVHDVNAPDWGVAAATIDEFEPDTSAAGGGAGFGAQCYGSAGYNSFVDWVEVWKG